MNYYHLTQPEFLDAIMQDGLKPMLGDRAKSICDKKEKLCLCTEYSIDAWAIMLGTNTVLKIQIPDERNLKEVDQNQLSDEWDYNGVIPPENIIEQFTIHPKKSVLDSLRKEYIYGLSEFCEFCARYYTELAVKVSDVEYLEYLKDCIRIYGECLIPVIPRLKYPEMSKEERKAILKSIGNSGEYTFCDDYYVHVEEGKPIKRLYQMLTEYPNDEFTELRQTISKMIKENFRYCLRVNTGGWTG